MGFINQVCSRLAKCRPSHPELEIDRDNPFLGHLVRLRKLRQFSYGGVKLQGGNSQNFLGKNVRFFVTLRCFY